MATSNIENKSGSWELKKTSSITGGVFTLYINKVQKLGAIKWQGNSTALPAGTYSFAFSEYATGVLSVLMPIYTGDSAVVGFLEVTTTQANLRTSAQTSWSSCTVIVPLASVV